MKPIIFIPKKNASRIKVFIPYTMTAVRQKFKQLNSTWWHPNQKLWSIINTANNLKLIKEVFNNSYTFSEAKQFDKLVKEQLDDKSEEALLAVEKTLVIKRYGVSTIKSYKNMLHSFFANFKNSDLQLITKEQIEGFIYQLIKKK